jgi:hypothetical protein
LAKAVRLKPILSGKGRIRPIRCDAIFKLGGRIDLLRLQKATLIPDPIEARWQD